MGLIFAALVTNIYSCFQEGFFRSPFSKIINIATPISLFIYLILSAINKKQLNKKLHDQFSKFFSKN